MRKKKTKLSLYDESKLMATCSEVDYAWIDDELLFIIKAPLNRQDFTNFIPRNNPGDQLIFTSNFQNLIDEKINNKDFTRHKNSTIKSGMDIFYEKTIGTRQDDLRRLVYSSDNLIIFEWKKGPPVSTTFHCFNL